MVDKNKSDSFESSKHFYLEQVAPMLHERFPQYEDHIAVGLAGEGSDCFGYDDLISRDHDFGTGVCLWLTDEDMDQFGAELTEAYDELAYSGRGAGLSARLRERRGVMTIHDFYSDILGIDCDTANCRMSNEQWRTLDHTCLATAVNGEVFRDDAGVFTAFRHLLLSYYPEEIWRMRLAEELHRFASSLQVNYARCMTRGDIVAAQLCRQQGLESSMELFFLLRRVFPPYYKWTFRRLNELDKAGSFSVKVRRLAEASCEVSKWSGVKYDPDRLNLQDPVVLVTEEIAADIVRMLQNRGFTRNSDPYLERYVDEVLG